MGIQRQAFAETFKQTEIYVREVKIRKKDILEFSNTMNGYFNIVANDAWNMWQQAQKVAVPDGFVLALKELPQAIAEELALDRVNKPFGETDPTWLEITEKVYQEHLRNKEFELCRDYKAMIEAREQVQ